MDSKDVCDFTDKYIYKEMTWILYSAITIRKDRILCLMMHYALVCKRDTIANSNENAVSYTRTE